MKIPCVPILPNRFCRILKEEITSLNTAILKCTKVHADKKI